MFTRAEEINFTKERRASRSADRIGQNYSASAYRSNEFDKGAELAKLNTLNAFNAIGCHRQLIESPETAQIKLQQQQEIDLHILYGHRNVSPPNVKRTQIAQSFISKSRLQAMKKNINTVSANNSACLTGSKLRA